MTKRDYYEVLGVARDADDETLKKSYRKLALQFHPDRNPGNPEAEAKFKELGFVYEVLSDPEKRAAYDRYGHDAFDPRKRAGTPGGGFHDPSDIFRTVFGGGGGGSIFEEFFGGGRRDPTGPQRGEDLRYDLELTFEEAANGCEKEISVSKPEACTACQGSGAEAGSRYRNCPGCEGRGQVRRTLAGFITVAEVCPRCAGAGRVVEKPCRTCRGEGRHERTSPIKLRIPPGVDTGSRLRSTGNGEGGLRGGPSGDLYVILHVKPHDIFQRENDDLLCEVPVSFVQAALGAEIEVPTLSGKSLIKLPPGTQPGTLFRIRGKGIRNVQGHGTGDLHVRVTVEIPSQLNAAQRAKLQEFADVCYARVNPISQSFWDKAKRLFTGI